MTISTTATLCGVMDVLSGTSKKKIMKKVFVKNTDV